MGEYQGTQLDDVILIGHRLTLRRWRTDDAAAVFAAMQDRRMHEFLPLPDPYTHEDAQAFVAGLGDEGRSTGTGLGCALEETATGRLVGSAALRLPKPRHVSAEIGYAVYPAGQGNGYAAEATRLLTAWAFDHGLTRVQLRCAVRNLASAKTALNAGFRFEAILRGEVLTARGPVDGAVFARLAGDPDAPIAPVFAPLPKDGLSDGVLGLRWVSPDDLEAILDEENDPLVRGWAFTTASPNRAELVGVADRAALQWLVGPVGRLTMVDLATGQTAGSIQLRQVGPPQIAGIGYSLRPTFRGRGLTARALRLVSAWAFDQGGFARLELGAKAANVASQRAALAGGFEPDGVRAARLRNPDGTFSDEVRFALVNPATVRPE
jgi:RimJ/RimL family protein N-acetyltransferase